MKLRIRGNSARLRLTKTEVKHLAEKGLVEEKTDFGNGQTLVYAIFPQLKWKLSELLLPTITLKFCVPKQS